ncbi:MAG: hypothetical protein M0C28_01115 [Candidatus Moduliflexus flocculans]|nr:hypothetical protein [Candidatus Moduliflexus flocculans]
MAVLRPAQGRHRRTTPRARSRSSTRVNNPEDPAAGTRKVPFSRELYIERDDFMEDPPPKFFRLAPGQRGPPALRLLHHAATRSSRTPHGDVVELRCTYDPATRGGDAPDGRKVKATLHWVSAAPRRRRRGPPLRHASSRSGTPRASPRASTGRPTSIPTRSRRSPGAKLEPALAAAAPGEPLPVRAPGLLRAPTGATRRPARPSSTGR